MTRTIILQSKPDAPIIDAFRCSDCDWSYEVRQPMPYDIPEQDATRAWREFDQHRCADFNCGK